MTRDHDYKDILDHLLNAVYTTDGTRTITYWNHAAEQLTGFRAEEVLGHPCSEDILMHVDGEGNSLCRNLCPLAASIADGKVRETLVYLHHKDGHRVPVQVRTAPLRNGAGEVVGGVEIFEDATNHITREDRLSILERMAYLDPLTQTGNRRYLEDTLKDWTEEFQGNGWPFGVLFFDIDHFKNVNDRYGHATGDQVLAMVARTIQGNLRNWDAVGRWGGEEFLVLCKNVDAPTLKEVAERLRLLVEASTCRGEDGSDVQVTVSCGVTLAEFQDSPELLVSRADRLLYRSKQEGRNRVSFG